MPVPAVQARPGSSVTLWTCSASFARVRRANLGRNHPHTRYRKKGRLARDDADCVEFVGCLCDSFHTWFGKIGGSLSRRPLKGDQNSSGSWIDRFNRSFGIPSRITLLSSPPLCKGTLLLMGYSAREVAYMYTKARTRSWPLRLGFFESNGVCTESQRRHNVTCLSIVGQARPICNQPSITDTLAITR